MQLPCGRCLGCRQQAAKLWALRCQLELQKHDHTVFTTLTYDPEHVPITLQKRHLQLWLKKLRREIHPRKARFFASGEYGDQNGRPHYHAILFGVAMGDAETIRTTWGLGRTATLPVTPNRIAYVAGYTAKKIGFKEEADQERVDPDTGEVYNYQPPFIQMSRVPGLGHQHRLIHKMGPLTKEDYDIQREKNANWREHAIYQGQKTTVPRYYHTAWQQTATQEEKDQLKLDKLKALLTRDRHPHRLAAEEAIAIQKQKQQGEKRQL